MNTPRISRVFQTALVQRRHQRLDCIAARFAQLSHPNGPLRSSAPPQQVAKKHGCGNKWGLFASYIPRRVGYQCSAAYRNIMLPRVRARVLLGGSSSLCVPSGPLPTTTTVDGQSFLSRATFTIAATRTR